MYRANSLTSSSIIFFGSSLNIWRDNSDPIDPPAPVIKTTFESIFLLNNSLYGSTCSLPNKSSMSKSLISEIVTRPSTRSDTLGNVFTITLCLFILSPYCFVSEFTSYLWNYLIIKLIYIN